MEKGPIVPGRMPVSCSPLQIKNRLELLPPARFFCVRPQVSSRCQHKPAFEQHLSHVRINHQLGRLRRPDFRNNSDFQGQCITQSK